MTQRTNDATASPALADILETALIEDHLKITYADEADYITQLGAAAIQTIEKDTNASFGAGTITVEQDELPSVFSIPVDSSRVSAISIAYTDANGASQTLDAADFAVSTVGYPTLVSVNPDLSFELRAWGVPVVITVTATADPMSTALEMACLLLIAHWYENREAAGAKMHSTPLAYDRLIANERIPAQRATKYTTR